MPRNKRYVGQQIGFLTGQTPQAPNPSPFVRPPMPNMYQNAPSFPYGGGGVPTLPAPQATPPSGLGGLLQGLTGGSGGSGGLNLQGLLGNAQKMIGAINQAGDVFKNMGPMLQMLKGLGVSELVSENDDTLTELDVNEIKSKPKKKRKRRKRKRKSRTTKKKRRR